MNQKQYFCTPNYKFPTSDGKYCFWSTIAWTCGWKGPTAIVSGESRIVHIFSPGQGWVPLIPVLFNGHLYYNIKLLLRPHRIISSLIMSLVGSVIPLNTFTEHLPPAMLLFCTFYLGVLWSLDYQSSLQCLLPQFKSLRFIFLCAGHLETESCDL